MNNGAVASDLEGTLTTGETWRILGEFLKSHGRGSAYQRFFYARMPGLILARAKVINPQAFREQWFGGMTALLAGFSRAKIDELVNVIADELWRARREDVLAELAQHRATGYRVLIVSGTYQQVANIFAKKIGALALATPLEFDAHDNATGKLAAVLNTGEAKVERLRAALDGAPLVAAYGDTEGDIPMLTMAQSAVAVYPDAKLRAAALANNWHLLGA